MSRRVRTVGRLATLRRALSVGLVSLVPIAVAVAAPSATPPPPVSSDVAALPGFALDDHVAALKAFRASCTGAAPLRPALPPPPALAGACAEALALPAPTGDAEARGFFERRFTARRVGEPGHAFFTGYYEPVVEGALTPTPGFDTPLYAPPPTLVSVKPGEAPAKWEPGVTAALRRPDGTLVAPPDRAAIEAGALRQVPIVYLRDPVEAFFVQVQGSARVRLPDGSLRRLAFAGRNGYPYTSIGKLLVARLGIAPDAMGMSQLRAWLRANGEAPDQPGGRLMQSNRSYIFFRFDDALPSGSGPVGGEGVPLTPMRSLAIDRSAWPYGLPFYVETNVAPTGMRAPFRRLMVAQDTGSAILGAARGDIFFGTGSEAASRAGPMRSSGTLTVLWPK